MRLWVEKCPDQHHEWTVFKNTKMFELRFSNRYYVIDHLHVFHIFVAAELIQIYFWEALYHSSNLIYSYLCGCFAKLTMIELVIQYQCCQCTVYLNKWNIQQGQSSSKLVSQQYTLKYEQVKMKLQLVKSYCSQKCIGKIREEKSAKTYR